MSDLPQGWTLTPLHKVIKRARRSVNVTPETLYYQIGIRSHGLGIFHKEPVTGGDIGSKRIYWLQPGDFVLNIVFAWEGAVALVSDAEEGRVGSHRFPTFVANRKKCDPRFLLRYFQTKRGVFDLGLVSPGGAGRNKTLNQADFLNLKIGLPPVTEQRVICDIIDTWDEAIALTERLIAALQQRKRGLMQRLLTGEVRFPEFEITRETQQTRYGELPADWDYVPIGTVAREVSNRNSDGDNLTVLSCTKYDGLVDSLEYFGRQIFSEDTSTYKVVRLGQFAYATNHIEEGSIGYQDRYEQALISPMYTVFETNDRVDDRYLFQLLKTELYRHIFEVNTSASVNRRGSLRWSAFRLIKIPLPPPEEQKAIAEVLEACEEHIAKVTRFAEALREQKKGLMQRLLTGQIRVRVEA